MSSTPPSGNPISHLTPPDTADQAPKPRLSIEGDDPILFNGRYYHVSVVGPGHPPEGVEGVVVLPANQGLFQIRLIPIPPPPGVADHGF